jgi:hypothetical protein
MYPSYYYVLYGGQKVGQGTESKAHRCNKFAATHSSDMILLISNPSQRISWHWEPLFHLFRYGVFFCVYLVDFEV